MLLPFPPENFKKRRIHRPTEGLGWSLFKEALITTRRSDIVMNKCLNSPSPLPIKKLVILIPFVTLHANFLEQLFRDVN